MATGIPNIETLFDLEALANLQNRLPPDVAKNIPTGPGGFMQNLRNVVTQQPQLGPDEFGSYVIPPSDPTYRTGFDYARSIAGGIPMSQVIAPGVSYSPEQPGGYTQEQLNTAVGTTPVEPPSTQEPDDPRYLGTGIGGVNIPDTRGQRERGEPLQGYVPGGGGIDYGPGMGGGLLPFKPRIPISLQDFGFGPGIRPTEIINSDGTMIGSAGVTPPQDSLGFDKEQLIKDIRESIDIPKPPSIDREALIEDITGRINIPQAPRIDREDLIKDITQSINIPSYEVPDLSGLARLEDIPQIPAFDPKDYREDFLSIAREGIDIPQYQAPDLSGFARLEDIPSFDPSVLKQDILMSIPQQQVPDVSQFVTQEDIQKAISGINIPTYQAPDLSAYDTRIAELEQQLAGLQTPTGGRFSVDQQLPRGLF